MRGKMPWDSKESDKPERTWRESDDAGVCWYMEKYFKIHGDNKVRNALLVYKDRHAFNRVVEYLNEIPKWDGIERLDTMFIDYLGAEDTEYTRAVTRKCWAAAVARALNPGTKFDNMVVITGAQGIGKSTLIKTMGDPWFSDSLKTFEGKEACELIQGVWIVEIAELAAFNKAETSKIKHFLSQTEDIFRAAYAKNTEWCPRRCVFFGTTNDIEYLKDSTGDRRFWPVDAGIQPIKKSVWNDLPIERDQIWAEALYRYTAGEILHLPINLLEAAQKAQSEHQISDDRAGMIQDFVEMNIPEDWYSWTIQQRRMWLNGGMQNNVGTVRREKICPVEIWAECFGMDPGRFDRFAAKEIRSILDRMQGWTKKKEAIRINPYGVIKGYVRAENT